MKTNKLAHGVIHTGDALKTLQQLPGESIHCCVTSPPYWGLRDYGVPGQIGLEQTVEDHIAALVQIFREVRRVLRKDGTLWVNYGDTYLCNQGRRRPEEDHRVAVQRPVWAKPKDLLGLPWRLAFALQADGWYLRSDVIWHKPNCMPESVTDRPVRAHEYLFLLARSDRYYYDQEAVREPTAAACGLGHVQSQKALSWARIVHEPERPRQQYAQHRITKRHSVRPSVDTHGGGQGNGYISYNSSKRNKRDVWSVPTQGFPFAHFATFPPELIRPCIRAGAPKAGTVLDPFLGSGTTSVVAIEEERRFVGVELNPDYVALAQRRIQDAEAVARRPRQVNLSDVTGGKSRRDRGSAAHE